MVAISLLALELHEPGWPRWKQLVAVPQPQERDSHHDLRYEAPWMWHQIWHHIHGASYYPCCAMKFSEMTT